MGQLWGLYDVTPQHLRPMGGNSSHSHIHRNAGNKRIITRGQFGPRYGAHTCLSMSLCSSGEIIWALCLHNAHYPAFHPPDVSHGGNVVSIVNDRDHFSLISHSYCAEIITVSPVNLGSAVRHKIQFFQSLFCKVRWNAVQIEWKWNVRCGHNYTGNESCDLHILEKIYNHI